MDISLDKRRYIGLILLYGMVALSFLSPIASDKVIPKAATALSDYTRLVVQGGLALKEGQFPIRVSPVEHTGLGYPVFQFYSPLTYTIAGFIYNTLTPKNPFLALKITMWLFMVVGAFYVFRLLKQITKDNVASTLAGVVYLAAPYVLINIHARGATPELIGQCVLPLLLYYVLQPYLGKSITLNNLFISGLMWSVLAMIHLITFVNTSIMIAFFLLFLKADSKIKKLICTSFAFIYGFLLSAWYLGPIVLFQQLLYISDTLINPVATNFLTLFSRLCAVVSTSTVSTASYARTGLDSILSPPCYPAVGLITLLSVGLCCYITWINPNNDNFFNKKLIESLLYSFFLAFFITWTPFDFWKYLPKILVIEQFSYRFLAQIVWIGTLLAGIAITVITKGKHPLQTVLVGLVVICLSSSSWLTAEYDHALPISNIIGDNNLYYNAYLIKPTVQLNEEISKAPLIMDHTKVLPHCKKIRNKLSCHILMDEGGLLELPVLYYPNLLNIIVDGKKINYLFHQFAGYFLVGVNLSPGEHTILVKFSGLSWSNWISIITWFILMVNLFSRLVNKIIYNIPKKNIFAETDLA